MSEPEQLELQFIDPPQLDKQDFEILSLLVKLEEKEYVMCAPNQIGHKQLNILSNLYRCVLLLEHKLPEVNKLISRRYELEQLLEKQNG